MVDLCHRALVKIMTITTRNLILVIATLLLVFLFVIYLWAPSFLQKNPGIEIDPSTAQKLFATSSRSVTGTITEVTDDGFRIEIPTSALEYGAGEALRFRTVVLNQASEVVRQEQRSDMASYEAELRRYQQLQSVRALTAEEYAAIVSSTTAVATTTVIERRGTINPALPVVYATVTPRSFEEFIASTTAAIVGSSTEPLDQAPSPIREVTLERTVLEVGMTVAVIGSGPVSERTEILAEKVVVMD